jgi:hypothetical protein
MTQKTKVLVTMTLEYQTELDALHINWAGASIPESAVHRSRGFVIFPANSEFEIPTGKLPCTASQVVSA